MRAPADAPSYDIERWRGRLPLLRHSIPLNHCTHAPLLEDVREAGERYLASWRDGGVDWDAWSAEVEGARAAFARLIGAVPEDVAITTSVSAATNSVASALDILPARRVIVTTEAEFPTVGQVWLSWSRAGADVRWVPERDGSVATDDVMAALDERTCLVSLTHAAYRTGSLLDVPTIARAAHERGALVFVDAFQTVGALEVDVGHLGADFLVAGSHKFLLGGPGIAFLWVRPERAAALRPLVAGWYGRADPAARDPKRLDWAEGARRFELGTPPVAAAYLARAGMEVLLEAGPSRAAAWLRVLGRTLVEGGEALGLEVYGSTDITRKTVTTAFRVPDPVAAESALRRRGILASARGPGLRLAPHFYSTTGDVQLALEALAEVVNAGSREARG